MGKLRVTDRVSLVVAFGQHDGFQSCWVCGSRAPAKVELHEDFGKDMTARKLRDLLVTTSGMAISLDFVDGERRRPCKSEDCETYRRHDAIMTEYPPESVAAMVAVLDNLISGGGGK